MTNPNLIHLGWFETEVIAKRLQANLAKLGESTTIVPSQSIYNGVDLYEVK
jgi:hypothetical protein